MADAYYTESKVKAVVTIAVAAANARINGKTSYTAGSGSKAQSFDLTEGGMCARFVRQCFETGCQMTPKSWKYRGGNAIAMLGKLKANGHTVSTGDLDVGDIIGHSKYPDGHVAIYVGKINGIHTVAENTSSGKRGNPRSPGTKLTPISEMSFNQAYRLHEAEEKKEQSWNFTIVPDAADVVAKGMGTTWTDSVTRTGVSAGQSGIVACSIPRALCDATAGSPFAGVPDYTVVRVYLPRTGKVVYAPVIDEGPGWSAKAGTGIPGSAMIDLTPQAWVDLGGTPDKNEMVLIRILRGSEKMGKEWAENWK